MKAYQRIIREQKAKEKPLTLFQNHPDLARIDIKQAVLKKVTYSTAEKIIKEYEWLGSMGTTQFHYGIFYDGFLAGVVCFGYFQAMVGYGGYVGEKLASSGIQLSRGACVWWAHKHSGSKLIAYGLKEMKRKGYKFVIAFSDSDAGEIGTLYQATNWYYLGIDPTSGKTNKGHFMLFQNGKSWMNDRDFNKKYGFKNLDSFLAKYPSIKKIPTKPKARYIKLIGSKSENKLMMKTLKKHILPYPKRNNDR